MFALLYLGKISEVLPPPTNHVLVGSHYVQCEDQKGTFMIFSLILSSWESNLSRYTKLSSSWSVNYRAIIVLMPTLLLLIAGRTPLAATGTSTSTTSNGLPIVQAIMAQQGVKMPWSGPMPSNLTVGCYEISSNDSSWQSISCAPANETAGIEGVQGGDYYGLEGEGQTGYQYSIDYSEADVYVSSCTVFDESGSCEETTNNTHDGSYNDFGDWSLQLNTNDFTNPIGDNSWVQFSYQNWPDQSYLYGGPLYQVCISQWNFNVEPNVPQYKSCVNTLDNEFYPGVIVTLSGDASGSDVSDYACISYPGGSGPTCWGLVEDDYEHLTDNWLQSYSDILGVGGNARANFASGTSLAEDTEILGPASYRGGTVNDLSCGCRGVTGETNDLSYSNLNNGHQTTNGNEEWYLNFDSSN